MVFGADPVTARRDAKDIVDLDMELARVGTISNYQLSQGCMLDRLVRPSSTDV